ncbi:GDYXXLXY domain-containing protein [Alcaligenaceae bacterium B3P038]|nr:GDYXXLXY domain-containing protein [Alcaligenaceae bacterium B3P038]
MQVQVAIKGGSEQHRWVTFLARFALTLGAVLLASGLICFIAANWAQMTKTMRLGGVQVVLLLLVGAALAAYPRCARAAGVRQAVPAILLGLGGVAIGGLLAVIGQAYQTGADSWMLFAGWAVLLLPWAAAARAPGVWLLWCAIVNVAAIMWWGTRDNGPLSLLDSSVPGIFLAGVNLVLVAGWEFALRSKMARPTPATHAMIAIVAAVCIVSASSGALTSSHLYSGEGRFSITLWVFVTLGAGAYYRYQRLDRSILALLALGAMAMSLRILFDLLGPRMDEVLMLLVLAVMVIGQSVLIARWLKALPVSRPAPSAPAAMPTPSAAPTSSSSPPTPPAAPNAAAVSAGTPWPANGLPADVAGDASASPTAGTDGSAPASAMHAGTASEAANHDAETNGIVQAVLGVSAWLSMGLIAAVLVFSGLVDSEATAITVGAIAALLGLLVLKGNPGAFMRQAAISLGVAGQALLTTGLVMTQGPVATGLIMTVVAVVMIVLADDPVWRFVSGLVLAAGLTVFVVFDNGVPVLAVLALGVSAGLLLIAALRFGYAKVLPVAWALAIGAHVVVAFGDYSQGFVYLENDRAMAMVKWMMGAYYAISLLPTLMALVIVTQPGRAFDRRLAIALPAIMLAFAWPLSFVSGAALAVTWILAGFAWGRPIWQAFGAAMMATFLWMFYYDLGMPLLAKSYLLLATGAALWLVGAAPTLWRRMRARRAARGTAAAPADIVDRYWRVAVLGGLGVILALANASIYRYETILATGRTVMLQLAPVDPRALLQGDYMALRFDVARQVERARYKARADAASANPVTSPGERPALDGYLVLELDRDGIAQLVRIQPARTPLNAGETLLRYRIRNDQTYIVTNAFFFPEGEAKHFEAARFGELRVSAEGTGLLVKLRDGDLNPL